MKRDLSGIAELIAKEKRETQTFKPLPGSFKTKNVTVDEV